MGIKFSDAAISICQFDGYRTLRLYRLLFENFTKDYFQVNDTIYSIDSHDHIIEEDLTPQKIKAYAKINPEAVNHTRINDFHPVNFRVNASISDITKILTKELTSSIFGKINMDRMRSHFPIYRSIQERTQILSLPCLEQLRTALIVNKNQYMQLRERDFLYSVTGDFYISIVHNHIEERLFDLFCPNEPNLFNYTNPISLKYILDKYNVRLEKPVVVDAGNWQYFMAAGQTSPFTYIEKQDFKNIDYNQFSVYQLGMENITRIFTNFHHQIVRKINQLIEPDKIE